MRYKLELQYNGTAYHGWQYQPNAITIQEVLESSLTKLLKSKTTILGAGRTDAGVHASYYVAHFDTWDDIEDLVTFRYHLNRVLPNDIAVNTIEAVDSNFHARFDATYREYKYYISLEKNPFLTDFAAMIYTPIDIDKMNEAAAILLDTSDFTTFCKLHTDNKTNICRVSKAIWVREGQMLIFTISADRFLRNMVRSIVGTLLDVGRGKYSVDDFREIVNSQDLSRSSASAPAQGLYLTAIKY